MAVVSTSVPDDIVEELDTLAGERLVRRSVVIRWAIDDFLRRRDPRFFMPNRSIDGTIGSSNEQDSSEPAIPTS